jgi:hypothetical protein
MDLQLFSTLLLKFKSSATIRGLSAHSVLFEHLSSNSAPKYNIVYIFIQLTMLLTRLLLHI